MMRSPHFLPRRPTDALLAGNIDAAARLIAESIAADPLAVNTAATLAPAQDLTLQLAQAATRAVTQFGASATAVATALSQVSCRASLPLSVAPVTPPSHSHLGIAPVCAQGSGGQVQPQDLSSGNAQAVANAINAAVQGDRRSPMQTVPVSNLSLLACSGVACATLPVPTCPRLAGTVQVIVTTSAEALDAAASATASAVSAASESVCRGGAVEAAASSAAKATASATARAAANVTGEGGCVRGGQD